MRVRLNWPLVVLLTVFFVSSLAAWVTLVLAKVISPESGWTLLSHFAAIVGGSLVPVLTYWKEKKISFDLSDSDPPTPNNAGDRKP